MKIQFCSDLHLEFPENERWLIDNPIVPTGDILLIAGDTINLNNRFHQNPFFNFLSNNFEMVYLIPGNHEFYAGQYISICEQLDFEFKIRENVVLVNNAVKEIAEHRFLFTTLWSKIERHIGDVLMGMNDFRLIRYKDKPLTIDIYNHLFEVSWTFLKEQIMQPYDGKTVVMTHHLPSNHCNLEMYRNSKINEAFCIDLTDDIMDSYVDYWIYGHSHGNKANFQIENTTMMTNQLGYVSHGEHKEFDRQRLAN